MKASLSHCLTCLFAITLLTPAASAATGDISTFAGDGTGGFGGDGGPATAAQLKNPYGNGVFDAAGNFYFADSSNHRIRKVDTSGIISTVAGDGTVGFSGDGAAATAAKLNLPLGVAFDAAGNLYIADTFNHRIRKVDTSGNISTVAGDGTPSFGGDGGPATAAQLNQPYGVALDAAGNLYIADFNNSRIRKVDTSGNISTVAGDGTFAFGGDGGAATAAKLNAPTGVATDAAGNLYIVDRANHRIRKVDTSGNISTVAGDGTGTFGGDGGPAIDAQISIPWSVLVDAVGNLYIADFNNHRIRKVDTSGNISTVAGDGTSGFGGDGGLATAAQLNGPTGVATDNKGNLLITDTNNSRIRRVEGIVAVDPGNTGGGGGATSPPKDTWSVHYQKADSDFAYYISIGDTNFAWAFYYFNKALGDFAFHSAYGRHAEATFWFHTWVGAYHYYYFQIIPGAEGAKAAAYQLRYWYAWAYYYYHSKRGEIDKANELFNYWYSEAQAFL